MMFIPFCRHSIDEDEAREVVETLQSDWLTTGPKTKQFEQDFASYIGCQHAVAVNSCTAALHLALLANGIGPGDEVITTPLTFCATAEAIEYCGARPIFVDVDANSFNIDGNLIESKITARTKCILPVHYGGIPCDLRAIYELAERYNLVVVEDAAHAVGSCYEFQKVGSFGHATCFSFYPTKNMTTGEGGMITLNDAKIADKIRVLALHGMSKDAWQRYSRQGSWYYEIHDLGYKYNMTDMQSAMGICQLKKLDHFNKIRETQAKRYFEILTDIDQVTVPAWYDQYFRQYNKEGFLSSWHLFVMLLKPDGLRISRDQFIEELNRNGIGTSVHFIPLHLQPYYAKKYGLERGQFPVTEAIYHRLISLPIYPKLTDHDIIFITDTIKRLAARFKN